MNHIIYFHIYFFIFANCGTVDRRNLLLYTEFRTLFFNLYTLALSWKVIPFHFCRHDIREFSLFQVCFLYLIEYLKGFRIRFSWRQRINGYCLCSVRISIHSKSRTFNAVRQLNISQRLFPYILYCDSKVYRVVCREFTVFAVCFTLSRVDRFRYQDLSFFTHHRHFRRFARIPGSSGRCGCFIGKPAFPFLLSQVSFFHSILRFHGHLTSVTFR